MSLYDGPRDVSEHLDALESRLGASGYAHHNGQFEGWRAERELAQIRGLELELPRKTPVSETFLRLWRALRDWLHAARQTN